MAEHVILQCLPILNFPLYHPLSYACGILAASTASFSRFKDPIVEKETADESDRM